MQEIHLIYINISTNVISCLWRKHTRDLFIASLLAFSTLTTITFQPSTILAQTTDLCGSTISSDVELTADIICEGDGIRVGGDNLTVNLNVFTLRGSGVDTDTTGIIVDGTSGVIIKGPDMVTGFGTGIAYTDASGGAMRDVYVGTNDIGVLLDATTDTHVKQDQVSDSRIGVLNRASDNTEVENVILSRNDEGIRVEKSLSVDLDFLILMDSQTGIYLDEDSIDNEVFYNIMFRNEEIDVTFANPGEGGLKNTFGNNDRVRSIPAEICTGTIEGASQNQTQPEAGNSASSGPDDEAEATDD